MHLLCILLPTGVAESLPCCDFPRWTRCECPDQPKYALASCRSAGAASIVLNPEYGKPTHRGARTKVFVGLGLSGIVPVTHALLVHGFSNLVHDMGFGYLLLSGALYLVGALI